MGQPSRPCEDVSAQRARGKAPLGSGGEADAGMGIITSPEAKQARQGMAVQGGNRLMAAAGDGRYLDPHRRGASFSGLP